MQIDPIIAVKDVNQSALWYQQIFGFKRNHGGPNFAVLVSKDEQIQLCLHKWGEHDHPSMRKPENPGNGLILYFRTDEIHNIRENAKQANWPVVSEIETSANSMKQEFSLRDPDGYFLIVSEFHEYQG